MFWPKLFEVASTTQLYLLISEQLTPINCRLGSTHFASSTIWNNRLHFQMTFSLSCTKSLLNLPFKTPSPCLVLNMSVFLDFTVVTKCLSLGANVLGIFNTPSPDYPPLSPPFSKTTMKRSLGNEVRLLRQLERKLDQFEKKLAFPQSHAVRKGN